MLKKILTIASLFIIVAAGFFGYQYIKSQRIPDFNMVKAIPPDAAFIIDSENFIEKINSLSKNNKIYKELIQLEKVNHFNESLSYLMKLYTGNKNIKELMDDNRIIISAHHSGKENIAFLFLMQMNSFRDQKIIVQSIENLLKHQEKLKKREYNNTWIYQINTNNRELYFSFNHGILLLSPSAILLESAIRQSEVNESILNDSGFNTVQETAGKNVDANIYINLSQFPEIISYTLNEKYKSNIANFTHFGNWMELDVNLKDDAVLLNGFTFSDQSLHNYLNIFSTQEAVDHKLNQVLPANTSVFISLGISDNAKYFKHYKNYLNEQNKLTKYNEFIRHYQQKFSVNFEEVIQNNLDEEIALVITDNPNQSTLENSFIIMRTKSKGIVESEMHNILSQIADIEKIKKTDLIFDARIDKETVYKIYQLPVKELFKTVFGDIYAGFDNPYFTFIDNFMVVGNSQKSLVNFIHSNILHKTLKNDMKFSQFTDYLSSKSNFYFYTNLSRSPEYVANFLKNDLQSGLKDNIDLLRKFQAFAVQFRNNNDMIFNNIYLKYIPEIKDDAITVWESRLDTAINFKPCLVTNHYTRENEIFVQDLNHKIYLINKVGRILWRMQLNEKINSELYQVDYYKNGKLQLLFSTKNKIHLIDRNGNYVERYPIELRSPATAGIALFDYDKNLDYRIIVPCENKNVYLYGLDGNLINGWEFQQTDTHVNTPVQHFRVKTRDYILLADKYRIYILNRRGQERIRVNHQFTKSKNNSFILEPADHNTNTHFVTTDYTGMIKMIGLNGQVTEKRIKKYSTEHFFDYQDIDADGYKDYIFADKNKLEVFKKNGDKIFDYTFNEEITYPPGYYYFSYDDRKLGVVTKSSGQIYLFNSDGNIYKGFPLKGSTSFSIGYLGSSHNQFNLIVGSQYNFLYNYSVN
jgi:ribosomal protein L20